MTFEEYLIKKRINKAAFEAEDTLRFNAWETMYAQMHQNSFYISVKMVINDVRLKYHLKDEDIPKAASAIIAPKPAIRRAPVAKPVEETAAEGTLVTPEATEKKPATFKPRPVVKRPSALPRPTAAEGETPAAPLQEGEATPQPIGETEKPAAKPRPVIKRPVITKPASAITTKPEVDSESQTPSITDTAASTDKPVRPRPVIKRPSALQKPAEDTIPEETNTMASAEPATDQVTEAPKPPRPRPVIKRPAALAQPAEQVPEQEEAKPTQETDETATKPARPRPVIKRPAALAKPAEEQKQQDATDGVKPMETREEPASKPLRPRPIIKRPAPVAPSEPLDTGKKAENEPQENVQQTPEGKPKPPRPRPIIRRPARPEDSGDATDL